MIEFYITIWRIILSALQTGNPIVCATYAIVTLLWLSLHIPPLIYILLILKFLTR